jgi:hypothetical protein
MAAPPSSGGDWVDERARPARPAMASAPLAVQAAAPAPPPLAAPSLAARQAWQRLLGLLRDISTEAQRLRRRLGEIKRATDLADSETRWSQTIAEVTRARRIFDDTVLSIDGRITALHTLLLEHPNLHDRFGSEVTYAENEWEDVQREWPVPPTTEKEAQRIVEEVQRTLGPLQAHLDELVYRCCLVTVPPRVDQHLETLRVGRKLDFHDSFRDELVNEADRKRLLLYLRAHPNAVHGVVDVEGGTIHHVSPKSWRRVGSYFALAGALVLGFGVVIAFAQMEEWLGLADWPVRADQWPELARAYFFVCLGAFAHVAVDALKQVRSQGAAAPSALGDALLWLHVKEVPLLWSIACLWLGTLGMAATQQASGWQAAFFVGYGIDSFVDLFLQRFADFTRSSSASSASSTPEV